MGSLTLTSLFGSKRVFKLRRTFGGYFRNEADHRDYVAIGTAAGESLPHAALAYKVILSLVISQEIFPSSELKQE